MDDVPAHIGVTIQVKYISIILNQASILAKQHFYLDEVQKVYVQC